MKVLYLFNLLLLSYVAVGQLPYNHPTYVKVSGGPAFFGTDDIRGYGIYTEISHDVLNTSRPFCARLLVGGEISFESGGINPVLKNPSLWEMNNNTFHHTITTGLAAKLTWYPFTSIFPGFHIAVGPVLAYTIQTRENSVTINLMPPMNMLPPMTIRQSTLEFDNRLVAGYRIGTGYEFFFNEILFAGIRADFSNYNNGDVNTLLGAKLGYRF
jgi:hypothetical protein